MYTAMKTSKEKKSGFTLLEVMIALAFIALILVATANAQRAIVRAIQRSELRDKALSAVKNDISNLEVAAFRYACSTTSGCSENNTGTFSGNYVAYCIQSLNDVATNGLRSGCTSNFIAACANGVASSMISDSTTLFNSNNNPIAYSNLFNTSNDLDPVELNDQQVTISRTITIDSYLDSNGFSQVDGASILVSYTSNDQGINFSHQGVITPAAQAYCP